MFNELVRELKATEQKLVGQLEGVRGAIAALGSGVTTSGEVGARPVVRRRGKISAKGRAAISRAQKLRWAKLKAVKK